MTKTILFILLVCLISRGGIAAGQENDENLIEPEGTRYCRISGESRVPQEERTAISYEEVSPEVLESITGKGPGGIRPTFEDGPPRSAKIILGDEVEVGYGSRIMISNRAYSTPNTQVNSVVIGAK